MESNQFYLEEFKGRDSRTYIHLSCKVCSFQKVDRLGNIKRDLSLGYTCPQCKEKQTLDEMKSVLSKIDCSFISSKKSSRNELVIEYKCNKCGYIKEDTYAHIKNLNPFTRYCKGCQEKLLQSNLGERKFRVIEKLDNQRIKVACLICGAETIFHTTNIYKDEFCCSRCMNTVENEIRDLFPGSISTSKIIPPYELDFYFPNEKIAIEYDGCYWHSSEYKEPKYHQRKSLLCREKGIRLIHIFEDEWKNPTKKAIIIDIINHSLGRNPNKIYARQCEVKEIDKESYSDFCSHNHLQGTRGALVRLGLFKDDKLVQIASFGKPIFSNECEWEWVRGCPAINNNIVGGTSKLFSYFVKHYKPKSVVCYADFNKFDGKGYKECGFKELAVTAPDMFYVTANRACTRINRNPAKHTEYKELVKQGKLRLLYGAGNLKFAYHDTNN